MEADIDCVERSMKKGTGTFCTLMLRRHSSVEKVQQNMSNYTTT